VRRRALLGRRLESLFSPADSKPTSATVSRTRR
jgi:hypothetical protein